MVTPFIVEQPVFVAVDPTLMETVTSTSPAVSTKALSLLICSGSEENATKIANLLAQNTMCQNDRIFWLAPAIHSSSGRKAKEYMRKTQSWKRCHTPNSELTNKRCFADITDRGGYELYCKIERHPQIPITPSMLDFESCKDLKISIGSLYNVVELKDGHTYAAPLTYADLIRSFNWGVVIRDCVLFEEIGLDRSNKCIGEKRRALMESSITPQLKKTALELMRRQPAGQAVPGIDSA